MNTEIAGRVARPATRPEMGPRPRRWLALAVMAAIGALSVPVSASAVVTTKPYSITKSFYSTPLSACIHLVASGSIQYDKIDLPSPFSWEFKNPKLVNPTLRVTTTTLCTLQAAKNMSRVDMSQGWYENRCNIVPSIGVGFPWSIQVSATIDCGTESLGQRSTSYVVTASSYTQSNSGSPVGWSVTRDNVSSICVGGKSTVTAYIGSRSDTVTFSDLKACGT